MELKDFQSFYSHHPKVANILEWFGSDKQTLQVSGLQGSSLSVAMAAALSKMEFIHLFIAKDEDEAAYYFNDIKRSIPHCDVLFFPSSYKKTLRSAKEEATNDILRADVLQKISSGAPQLIIISYPQALAQKVVSNAALNNLSLKLKVNESIGLNALVDFLNEYGFARVDFVYEPGQFAVRGSIVDIFSFTNENPYRIDFFGDEVDSIRVFDIETQLSKNRIDEVVLVPDIAKNSEEDELFPITDILPKNSLLHFADLEFALSDITFFYNDIVNKLVKNEEKELSVVDNFIAGDDFLSGAANFRSVEWGAKSFFKANDIVNFHTVTQPIFNKDFDLIASNLKEHIANGSQIFIFSDSVKQTDRIAAIFEDRGDNISFTAVENTIHQGFIDEEMGAVCYTDHQIFDRFHKYKLKTDNSKRGKVLLTLKELNQLQIGDFVVHTDHGIGKFDGLINTEINGKRQEVVKLIYKDNDVLLVSIYSLHRISKYKGKDGENVKIQKLGSGAWQRMKDRTKSKVKDIARDLIKLYSLRKAEAGFKFSTDSYMQQELEASFIYEDTPDQAKTTAEIKVDMESDTPMDRLVCGDVGFGKTEIAIRVAFKAVADSKQVAVLVPTTVLAMQHYQTFKSRLKNFPCKISYLSRTKSNKEIKETLKDIEDGNVDIVIGTHKLVGKNVRFKDLGLLIVDEEQKFGVSVKEKLKSMKVNIDTLTLTATPIPRTLQFSLMGARDLSIINTPPPNHYPIHTELHTFNEELIRDAIQLEMDRNGQIFFVHNRIHNIENIADMICRLVPGCRVVVGHGQMSGDQLEDIIIDFMNYEYDVLVATTIIESGIDISNANTIIINDAHRFGLSDLHQLRGRVGRANRKAYCYLISPPLALLTGDAKRRLRAIEMFTDLGSGFNIAMQDLDIRGAGNMLGAEQSGFIADLGYETYQNILNEALLELKNEEFAELYSNEESKPKNIAYVSDCHIDTDLDSNFEVGYIENVSERIELYRKLDGITNEEQLAKFQKDVEDRFGKLPSNSSELFQIVRLRWIAVEYGVERISLRDNKMLAYLTRTKSQIYYESIHFNKLLIYASMFPRTCIFKEGKNGRYIQFFNVKSVSSAYKLFQTIDSLEAL